MFFRWATVLLIGYFYIVGSIGIEGQYLNNIVPYIPVLVFILVSVMITPKFRSLYNRVKISILNKYTSSILLRIVNIVISTILVLLCGVLIVSEVFVIPSWQLNDSSYFSELFDNLTSFTNWILISLFVYGATFTLIPLAKLYITDVVFLSKLYLSKYGEASKRVFHFGAETIDKMSKWAILITLVVYISYDRDQQIIANSFSKVVQYKGLTGDFGRKESIENLVSRNEDVVGADLSYSSLEQLDLSKTSIFYIKERPNLSLVKLDKANLRESNLSCGIFRGASMENSNLRDATLIAANLKSANLKGAEFGGKSYFRFTDLSYANLQYADLSNGNSRTIEAYDKFSEYIPSGGAYLYGANLRGAKLGRSVLGVDLYDIAKTLLERTSGWNSLSSGEAQFFRDFPMLAVLSSGGWDGETEFPEEIDLKLKELGVRDGVIKTKEQRLLVKRAKQEILSVYKQVYGNARYNVLVEMDIDEDIGALLGMGSGSKDNAAYGGAEFCRSNLSILKGMGWKNVNRQYKGINYLTYKSKKETSLIKNTPYPKFLSDNHLLCSITDEGLEQEDIVYDSNGSLSLGPFRQVKVFREKLEDGRDVVTKLEMSFSSRETRDDFDNELLIELEGFGHSNTYDENDYLIHNFLLVSSGIPVWVEYGPKAMLVTLYRPEIKNKLSEIEMGILERGIGSMPDPLTSLSDCAK